MSIGVFALTHGIAAVMVSYSWKTLNWPDGASYSRQGILIHQFGSNAESIEGKLFRFPTTNGILRFNSLLANFLGPGIHRFGASLISATFVVLGYVFVVRSPRCNAAQFRLSGPSAGPVRVRFRQAGAMGSGLVRFPARNPPQTPCWWLLWSVVSPIAVASTSFNLKESWVFTGCAVCAGGIARLGGISRGRRRLHTRLPLLGLAFLAGGLSIVSYFRAYLVPLLIGALIATAIHWRRAAKMNSISQTILRVAGLTVGAVVFVQLLGRFGTPGELLVRSESLGGRQKMGSVLGLPATHPLPGLLRMLIAPWPWQITPTPLGIAQTITATIDAVFVVACALEFFRLKKTSRASRSTEALAYFLFVVSFAIWLSYGYANLNAGAIVRQRSLVIPLLGVALARSRQHRIQFWNQAKKGRLMDRVPKPITGLSRRWS